MTGRRNRMITGREIILILKKTDRKKPKALRLLSIEQKSLSLAKNKTELAENCPRGGVGSI
jgi:hypothetical protein